MNLKKSWVNKRLFLNWLFSILVCAYGLYFTFHHFWKAFDAISGDLGDARFNSLVLEHTWLWVKGVHESLFNTPMFYPHPNAYAYSDFLLSAAPIYWMLRSLGNDILGAYQGWMILACVLNFFSFEFLASRCFKINRYLSAFGAYLFAFSLPRISHLEHVQLVPAYFIVLSAIGLLEWKEKPKSIKGPFLFFLGTVLQFLNAFYFFWFWLWSLCMGLAWILWNQERREALKKWAISWNFRAIALLMGFMSLLSFPFLAHYVKVSAEMGRRSWVTISNSVPRLYSWINLPHDHWEWKWLPFHSWIDALPVIHEHYLSFGIFTWGFLGLAFIWVSKQKKIRYLTIPLFAMFIFTLTSGRFSSWVFISYLFPAGGAIRAVGRIQIFMLLFWALISIHYLSSLLKSKSHAKKTAAFIFMALFFVENTYRNDWVFSKRVENERIQNLAKKIPADCKLIINQRGFHLDANSENLDAVMVAFQTGRITVNGYSGNQPKEFAESFFHSNADLQSQLNQWWSVHGLQSPGKECFL